MPVHADDVRPLHEVLAEEFAKTGMSQADFANAIGRSQQVFSMWLTGKGLRVEALPAIEDALGLPRGFLLRKAGYVADAVNTEDVIRADHAIASSLEREIVVDAYRSAVKRSSSAGGGARTSAAIRSRRSR